MKNLIKKALCAALCGALVIAGGVSAYASSWTDGSYTGKATGFGGDVKVKVTVSGGAITAINVTEHSGETEPYYTNALAVIDTIIDAQSTDVDTVSGATLSSEAIRSATENALKSASGVTDGTQFTKGSATYEVSSASSKTVTYVAPLSSKAKVTIPATVKYDGTTYKVTAISKGAFKNDTSLKTVTIGKNVAKIGANAFKGTSDSVTYKVPKANYTKLVKLLKKAGASKKATYTKI